MATAECERAIEDAVQHGHALLKFISPNDVGLTGGHQYGYYIPKHEDVWPLFTSHPPAKGKNDTHPISITWQNGRVTASNVKWYGVGTRSEYRITAFGKDFPFISHNVVGDLLVLIPIEKQKAFRAYVLDEEDDIEEITAQLGVSPAKTWALYTQGAGKVESEDDCIEHGFKEFTKPLSNFPTGERFSEETWRLLELCVKNFKAQAVDDALLRCMDTEWNLFRFVERRLCAPLLVRPFKDVDDFVATAQTMLQRRKSRAGRSLENHIEHFLTAANVPHKMQPDIPGEPDCVIPSEDAYFDKSYPDSKLFILGVKRTCRDRWRQVLAEGKRVKKKHILTIEQGISGKQLKQMQENSVKLVVPKPLHKQYPPKERQDVLVTITGFVDMVKQRLK